MVATYNTHTQLTEADSFSNFLIYYTEDGKAVFTGEPRIETDFGIGRAETFNLLFVENKLSHIEFVNDCRLDFSFEEKEDFTNWLTAEKIDIFFQDKKPKSMLAETNVIYQIITEEEKNKTKEYSKNDSASRKLQIVFTEENKIEEIRQMDDIQGSYLFKSANRKTQ